MLLFKLRKLNQESNNMRIIGGKHRGRELISPKGDNTRPTTDRIKESIFNILNHAKWKDNILDDATVLDAFAGTGALGFEALSHGAKDLILIEQNAMAIKTCQKNIGALGAENIAKLMKMDVLKIGKKPNNIETRSLVFIDPPYGKNLGEKILSLLLKHEWISSGSVCVMEMSKKDPEMISEDFNIEDERTYGITKVAFLTVK